MSMASEGFLLAVFVGGITTVVVGGLFYFSRFVFRQQLSHEAEVFLLLKTLVVSNQRYDDAALNFIADRLLLKKDEYWTLLGQFILSTIVVGAITILLLVGAITAEAGLPILAGIGGFALGKGATSGRSIILGRQQGQERG